MFEEIKSAAVRWNKTTNQRQKIQHTYIALIITSVIVAGVVSLINAELGHNLVFIAIACTVAFVLNGIVWHLLNSILISRLPTRNQKNK